jgi:DNA transposition AAA+ family ATPase
MNTTPRDSARENLRLYQSRSGLSLGEIANRMGYARRSLLQFVSHAHYGDGDGAETAKRIQTFIDSHPPEAPELPGKIYITENVRIIDRAIRKVQAGHWVLIYGPPATQKSFVFEYRMAEAWQKALEASVVYIYAQVDMSPLALLKEIAVGLGAYVRADRHATTRNILYTLRRRTSPVAIIIDEGQHLAKRLDTLETLREVADRGRIGLLVAGHDNVEDIFRPRPDCQLEQWRSRVEQHRYCLPGLSEDEAREILRGELGTLPEKTVKIFTEGSTVDDTRKRTKYISARRLFNAIRDFKEKKESKVN